MSKKSKKHKAKFYSGLPVYAPQAVRGRVPDFYEMQRQAELRAARHEELRYRIAPDCKVHIQFDGITTKEAIRKLIHYLEMGIGDFPETADYPPMQS
jgi:hypothetical protein